MASNKLRDYARFKHIADEINENKAANVGRVLEMLVRESIAVVYQVCTAHEPKYDLTFRWLGSTTVRY